MKYLLCFASFVAICWAMTTHKPHTTHEPNEGESMQFLYIPKTHSLVIRVHTGRTLYSCYVAALSDDEKMNVHTDSGLRALELKYVNTLLSATQVTMADLNPADVHGCGRNHNGTLLFYSL